MRVNTVTELIELLNKFYKEPDDTKISWIIYDQSEVIDFIDPEGVSKEHYEKILENFELSSHTLDAMAEDFNEAVDSVLGDFRCSGCGEYSYTVKEVEGDDYFCKPCGEEAEILG